MKTINLRELVPYADGVIIEVGKDGYYYDNYQFFPNKKVEIGDTFVYGDYASQKYYLVEISPEYRAKILMDEMHGERKIFNYLKSLRKE